MLQHESGQWSWGRYVVVLPVGNGDIADVCARYGELLTDRSISSITLEELLNSGAYPQGVSTALRTRYIAS
jgi:hypothetical protein